MDKQEIDAAVSEIRTLLLKTPPAHKIDTINEATAFKALHAKASKCVKGRNVELIQSIRAELSAFHGRWHEKTAQQELHLHGATDKPSQAAHPTPKSADHPPCLQAEWRASSRIQRLARQDWNDASSGRPRPVRPILRRTLGGGVMAGAFTGIHLPAFIDPAAWAGFVEMRKAKGKSRPFTQRAATMILMELYKLKEQGYCPNQCLDQSTMNGWSGVFATKERPAKPQQVTEDGQPKVIVLNNFLAAQAEHEELLSKPEEAERARAARLAAMQKIKGRAA